MDVQMLGFTSGFLAIPGLHLVGKRVCDAVLPSRASVVWLGRCESPQALVSLSRFILVLRELRRKLEEDWKRDEERAWVAGPRLCLAGVAGPQQEHCCHTLEEQAAKEGCSPLAPSSLATDQGAYSHHECIMVPLRLRIRSASTPSPAHVWLSSGWVLSSSSLLDLSCQLLKLPAA